MKIDRTNYLGYLPHFCLRARERGIASVAPDALWHDLHLALRTASDAVEHVLDLGGNDTGTIWRFRLPVEGVCYFIARGVAPVTVLTASMVKDYKLARKVTDSARKWRKAQAIAEDRRVAEEHRNIRVRKRTERWR